ncbi:hypothetical protein L2E82_32411 [Cichorium intybus]|uniref:Uncharacterized protein n=1 Tax=Cichorium intybus TaxID=13427 RepID=A0ACB9BGQ2_CICIN|nr:hypothetical protein L2E82_32411 [Cichorium intybus]
MNRVEQWQQHFVHAGDFLHSSTITAISIDTVRCPPMSSTCGNHGFMVEINFIFTHFNALLNSDFVKSEKNQSRKVTNCLQIAKLNPVQLYLLVVSSPACMYFLNKFGNAVSDIVVIETFKSIWERRMIEIRNLKGTRIPSHFLPVSFKSTPEKTQIGSKQRDIAIGHRSNRLHPFPGEPNYLMIAQVCLPAEDAENSFLRF